MDPKIAAAVLERAEGHCEKCGWPGYPLILHHRLMRSHGGPDTVDNLIAVHTRCHDVIHDQPEESYDRHWLLRGT